MRTRVINYYGSYIPQYEKATFFFFFKEWKDFMRDTGGSYVFNTKEEAEQFILDL